MLALNTFLRSKSKCPAQDIGTLTSQAQAQEGSAVEMPNRSADGGPARVTEDIRARKQCNRRS